MIRRPPRSTLSSSSAASDVYKRQRRESSVPSHSSSSSSSPRGPCSGFRPHMAPWVSSSWRATTSVACSTRSGSVPRRSRPSSSPASRWAWPTCTGGTHRCRRRPPVGSRHGNRPGCGRTGHRPGRPDLGSHPRPGERSRPLEPPLTRSRPRIVYNALPLSPRGGGVSTYIRELLAAMVATVDADLVAAVHPAGTAELPAGILPLVKGQSQGMRRALTGAVGFGPADLTHGLDVDLPLRGAGLMVSTVHDMAIFDVPWAFPRHRVLGERVVVRNALRRADAIIAVSSFTAERVRALVGRDPFGGERRHGDDG